jgi:hypothetical protein
LEERKENYKKQALYIFKPFNVKYKRALLFSKAAQYADLKI